jgi:hypothetical protein
MKSNELVRKSLEMRDYFIAFLRLIFFILIIFSFFGFWYVFSLEVQKFDDGKYSREGIKYVFENYGNSINVGTAFLAILAIYLTMRRMNQTQTQIQVMGANNQFNNFYKHREEFAKHLLSKTFIINLALSSGQSNGELIINYHGMYFGKNYVTFDAQIKSGKMQEIQKCFVSLQQFILLSNNFEKYILDGKPTLSYKGSLDHITETEKYFTNRYNEHKQKFIKWEENLDRLRTLCSLYYDYKIKQHILTFSGEIDKVTLPTELIENFETFLRNSKLYILVV